MNKIYFKMLDAKESLEREMGIRSDEMPPTRKAPYIAVNGREAAVRPYKGGFKYVLDGEYKQGDLTAFIIKRGKEAVIYEYNEKGKIWERRQTIPANNLLNFYLHASQEPLHIKV